MFGTMPSFDWCTLSDWLLQVLKHMRRLVKCGNQLSFFSQRCRLGPSSSLSWVHHLLSNRVYCFHLRAWDRAWNNGRYKRLYGGNTPVIQPVRFQDMFINFSAMSIIIFIFNDTKNILSETPRKVCKKSYLFFTKSLGNGPLLSFSSGSELALAA